MTEINEGFPTLIVLVGAGIALRASDWPGILAFAASMVLYGAMRFLERERANEMAELNAKVATLSDKLGSLAMTVGARGIL